MMANCTPSKLDSELQRDLQKYIWSGVQLVGGLGEELYEIGYYTTGYDDYEICAVIWKTKYRYYISSWLVN